MTWPQCIENVPQCFLVVLTLNNPNNEKKCIFQGPSSTHSFFSLDILINVSRMASGCGGGGVRGVDGGWGVIKIITPSTTKTFYSKMTRT